MADSNINPRTEHFEFRGPIGAILISVGLPTLIELFYFGCNADGCPAGWSTIVSSMSQSTFLSWPVIGVYLMWLLGLAILDIFIPGEIVRGTQLRTGGHLVYKFNGTRIMVLLTAILAWRTWSTAGELPELAYVYNHYLELVNSSLVVAVIISVALYIASFRPGTLLALGGNTGSSIYDWFIGRELNPRLGPLDLKLFLEMRPGLILWIIIDLAMIHHQYHTFGTISTSILLVTLFQAYYVVEGTVYEKGLVSMIDTTTDGLGFMLVFGDLSLVPFTYSLQARYLADHVVALNNLAVVGIIAIYVAGLAIFRLSNNEKGRFKAGDPSASHLQYLTAENGSKLIVSGWWGLARHINYTGDWLSGWAYCLPCGFSTPIPYYYVVYFATLLIHREQRDEAKCATKYGPTWIEYKRRVPYRFIPGVL